VKDGYITVPDQPGIGYEPNLERIDQLTVKKKEYNLADEEAVR